MKHLSYILLLLVLVPLVSWTHPIPSLKKSWLIYSSAGFSRGMQELGGDFQFGLSKSTDKLSLIGDIHFNSYSNSTVSRFNLNMGKDLLRIKHPRKRHPYYLTAYAGIGLTHLSNPTFNDSFMLKGDDMLNVSIGIQPRVMFTKSFGMMADIQFNQNLLIDYQLKRSLNANLGFILKIE